MISLSEALATPRKKANDSHGSRHQDENRWFKTCSLASRALSNTGQ